MPAASASPVQQAILNDHKDSLQLKCRPKGNYLPGVFQIRDQEYEFHNFRVLKQLNKPQNAIRTITDPLPFDQAVVEFQGKQAKALVLRPEWSFVNL